MDKETKTVFFVRLEKGNSFRTSFGVVMRKGVPLRVPSDSPHLPYFRSSSRFSIVDSVSTPRKNSSRLPVGRRPRSAKADKKKDGTSLTRKQLVKAARELGLVVRSSDNISDLTAMIKNHDRAGVSKAEKDAAAADASSTSSDAESSSDDELADDSPSSSDDDSQE